MTVDDIEAGKAAFNRLLAEVAPGAQAVIPVRATDDRFLIALSRGGGRVFVTVAEDDLLDLEQDDRVTAEVRASVVKAVAGLPQSRGV
ncbi:MAG: hypothetical protein OEW11_01585 [Nitrospirota bacterium]|nr:hypothetical protein [Nitrospirota bacterium]